MVCSHLIIYELSPKEDKPNILKNLCCKKIHIHLTFSSFVSLQPQVSL